MAGLQMGFVGFALCPILRPPITTLAAFVFMIPFLLGFLRDWLVICGQIETDNRQQTPWETVVFRSVTKWVAPVLRCFIGITGFGIASLMLSTAPVPSPVGATPVAYFPDLKLVIVFILLLIFLGLGLMGRLCAALLGLLTGSLILNGMHGFGFYALFMAACCLMITGSGTWSLWTPEEKIITGNR
jgi:CDP-diacylglycerol--glycerol-3-phosphate 3-phosphatidyltransferase